MKAFILSIFLGILGASSWSRLLAETPEQSSAQRPIHVVILIDKLDQFWTHFVRISESAAAQLGFRLSVFHGHESHLDMVRRAEDLVQTMPKPDVIMFKSFKGNGRQILDIATRHKVKTLSINAPMTLPPEAPPTSPYLIGELLPDDEQAGYELVKTLRAEILKKGVTSIHLAAINGDRADTPAQLRERGLRRAVAEYKDVTLHQLVSDAWTAPHAAKQFAIIMRRYPMINAVWGGNDTIALHVAESAKALKYRLGETLFLGGVDLSPEGLKAVQRGELVTSVGGHILDGGRGLVILHDYFIRGKLKQKRWLTPMEPVTRENVDAYLKVLDPAVKVPIDFRRFSRVRQPQLPYDFSFPIP